MKNKQNTLLIYSDDLNDMFGPDESMIANYNEVLPYIDKEPVTEFTDEVEYYHRELTGIYLDDFLQEYGDIPVICIADLGLWYGRVDGGKSGKLTNVLYSAFEDINEFYYDRTDGTFKLSAVHHDGTNYFTFYQLTKKGEEYLDRHGDNREAHEHVVHTKGYTKRIKYQ